MPNQADFTPRGLHLIAGKWVASQGEFTCHSGHTIAEGGAREVDRAVAAAEDAFESYGYSTREDRARFLETIAQELTARIEDITVIGTLESGLPAGRIQGELGRTTGQLGMFAQHIREGCYLDQRRDAALPDRQPLPRPELVMVQRPIGPIAVFGASNFPLAFSTAGGDTAAALAAGCPVVVKGHPAHPGTAEVVADAIHAAITACDIHPGTFSLIQGSTIDLGQALVRHPLIKAVGFTGSLRAGRALFDLCAARPEPIPFFGELGSVNPMFLLANALSTRAVDLGTGWAGSLTMGAGQFCTNPGIAVVPQGADGDAFVAAAAAALGAVGPQVMLTAGIAKSYDEGKSRFDANNAVEPLLVTGAVTRGATPNLYQTDAQAFMNDHSMAEEVFGPLALVVRVRDSDEMLSLAKGLVGQLTVTLHMEDADADAARQLLPTLERKAGRILFNGFPTGVEVADAMVHGGPYPASTNFGATSVGTMAIRRFLRPVCYQNAQPDLLPVDLS